MDNLISHIMDSSSSFLVAVILLMSSITAQSDFPHSFGDDYERPGPKRPKFQYFVQNITEELDSTATLACQIRDLGTIQVVWRRIDPNADPAEREQPLAIGKFVFSEDVRIRVEITRDDDITTSSLIIEKLEPTDAGQYACEINTRNPKFTGDLTRYIQLNVKEKIPESNSGQPPVSITGNKVVDKGEKLTLICNATGTTEIPYGIEWWHNSKPLTSRLDKGIRIQTMKDPLKKTLISILTIADSDPENSGDYICRTSDKEVSEIKVHVLDVVNSNLSRRGTPIDGKSSQVKSFGNSTHRTSFTYIAIIIAVFMALFH